MSYEPTNWKTGDVVTSAKLNKLENAVAQSGGGNNGVLIVHINRVRNVFTADKTYAEVAEAIANNTLVVVIYQNKSALMFQDGDNSDLFFAQLTPDVYIADDHVEFVQFTILMHNNGNVSTETYALKWAGTEMT